MILTITANPALDIYAQVDQVLRGEKLRCGSTKEDPGGGGINISRVIYRLGGSSTAIFPFGGLKGERLLRLLKEESIKSDPVEIRENIRENFAVMERRTGELYRFGFPGPHLVQMEYENILRKLNLYRKSSYWIASGSLPPGVPDDFYARIAAEAGKHNVKFVLDTSGRGYTGVLKEGVFLMKPNKEELQDLSGQKPNSEAEQKEVLLQLIEQYPVQVIVLSLGAEGALVASEGSVKKFPAPRVEKLSSIGAGDSMLAGMIYSLSCHHDLEKAVLFGLACGSATIKSPGTELLQELDVRVLYQKMLQQHQSRDFG